MQTFRQFHLIQSRHDGRFMTTELTYTHLATRAGKMYDAIEAIETARYHLDEDYVIFSAYELVPEGFH